jgi:cytochrome c553
MFVEAPDGNVYAKKGRPPRPGPSARLLDCPTHGPTVFHLYGAGTPEQRYRCKRCIGERVTRRLRLVKQTLVDDFGGACVVCGYDRVLANLHFHHVDPATKSFPMSMGRGRSLAAYRAEAEKCVLVCANCHGEIEAGVIPSPPPGARPGARRR